LEPDFLSYALGCMVVRIGDQLEPLQPEVFERVLAEKAKRARGDAPTSSFACAPVADVTRARVVDPHSDRPDDASVLGDRELLCTDPRNLSLDESARIRFRVWARDGRDPVVDLGVVAGSDDRRNVVERPGAQLDVAVE